MPNPPCAPPLAPLTVPCQQVLLGVDDMDVFKGIELKLQAYERLLEEHPEWRGKVVLVQVRGRGSRRHTSGGSAVGKCIPYHQETTL